MKHIHFYSPRNKLGFTLIEILFAMSIMVVMFTLLYNALFTVIAGMKVIDRSFTNPRRALILSRVFERELTGIYLPEIVKPPVPKKGQKAPKIRRLKERMVFGVMGKKHQISFTTLIPLDETLDPPLGDILEVGYEFDSSEKRLTKRIDPIPDEKLDKGGEEVTFPIPLREVKFEYYGRKWQSSWDSKKSKKLPRAIRATFEIISDEEGIEELSDEQAEALVIRHQIVVLLPNAVDNKRF
jgi:prepilin-type N-terminal cleavage/methylation domain-containing protein